MTEYIRDNRIKLFLHILLMILTAQFLLAIGNGSGEVALILISWALIIVVYNFGFYISRKRYLMSLMNTVYKMDKRYLISEVMEKPKRFDDCIFYEILKLSGKAMLERVSDAEREKDEYKEYIEQWVHKAKTPVAAIKLLCENDMSDNSRKILKELEKMNHYLEQTLYYARSSVVEKDYLIRKANLRDIIEYVIISNKHLLLSEKAKISIEGCEQTVYTDSKWIEFILSQLIVNAVQYKKDKDFEIKFYTKKKDDLVILYVEDNGIGISEKDIPRIFDKGFTGDNGRLRKSSTGMGLYLCKKLCSQLGNEIDIIHTKENSTTFAIKFNLSFL